MTLSVTMSSSLQSAEKAKAAVDKAIRDGAVKLKSMSAGDLSGFVAGLPANDRGFVERTAGAFRKMSSAQLDQVVAYMGAEQKRRLAAAFSKLPDSSEKSSATNATNSTNSKVEPAVVIKKASDSIMQGLVYGRSAFR